MSKALFRFLRGELNGFYITSIHNSLNEYSEDIKKFFIDFKNQQFEIGKISDETLFGLGKFASVFLPRRPVSESKSSLYMSNSHKVNDEEYSERGLYNLDDEYFNYVHTDQSITSPDINTLATEEVRSSLVGDEQVIGFISEDEQDVLDSDGNVKPEKVLTEPPANKAYSEFFGNQFLFLSEAKIEFRDIDSDLFLELFKTLQWIRYNGTSLQSLVKIISILCPNGLVKLSTLEVSNDGLNIYIGYVYDVEVPIASKELRLNLLLYLIDIKFKQVILHEISEG